MRWVDFLNDSLVWNVYETARELSARSGHVLTAAEHGRIVADVGLLWRLFASKYLDARFETQDHEGLLQFVEAVTPTVGASGDPSTALLQARRRRGALPEPFEGELAGAVLQFLATVTEPAVFVAVHRCRGVLRGDSHSFLSEAIDKRFAKRAGLLPLIGNGEAEAGLHQCERILHSARGRHFCSKACSNANFAARKAIADPRYFADKQERYRSRRQRPETEPARPASEGAFVYID